MPHTSRKKQQGPRKRMLITDDSGWTHISKATSNEKHQQSFATWTSSDQRPSPPEIPKGLVLRQVIKSFDHHMNIWKDSMCFKSLRTLLQDHTLVPEAQTVSECICLGLGSFTGGNYPETSLFELVALVSILEILAQKHEIESVYLQDPVFNSMDEEFLCGLGYTVVPSPEGFEKLCDTSFLFAPHLEWPVYFKALENASPSLIIGNNIQDYLDSPNRTISAAARNCFPGFVDAHSSRTMPEFDRSSWCNSTNIYWRRPMEFSDEAIDYTYSQRNHA